MLFDFKNEEIADVPEMIYLLTPKELLPHFLYYSYYKYSRFIKKFILAEDKAAVDVQSKPSVLRPPRSSNLRSNNLVLSYGVDDRVAKQPALTFPSEVVVEVEEAGPVANQQAVVLPTLEHPVVVELIESHDFDAVRLNHVANSHVVKGNVERVEIVDLALHRITDAKVVGANFCTTRPI